MSAPTFLQELGDFIVKVLPLLTVISALYVVYYQQKSIRELEKEKRGFEIQKENRAFVIQVKEKRVKQIEEYLYDSSEANYILLSYIGLAIKVKDQDDLDSLINEFWKNTDDNEKSRFTFYSIINSLSDAELTSILNELDNVTGEIVNLFNEIVGKDTLIGTIYRRSDSVKNEIFELRNKYRIALTKFYVRLDKLYEGWGIINPPPSVKK